MARVALGHRFQVSSGNERQVYQRRLLTATLRRRQSGQAPSFLINAARSLDCCDSGPVRLLLARRLLETSDPSFMENMDWCRLGEVSALYEVVLVSEEPKVAAVA